MDWLLSHYVTDYRGGRLCQLCYGGDKTTIRTVDAREENKTVVDADVKGEQRRLLADIYGEAEVGEEMVQVLWK